MSAPTWMLDHANHDDVPQLVTLLELLFAIEQDFSADPERQRAGLQGVIDSPLGHIAVARDAAGKAIAMCSAQLVMSTAEGRPSAWIEDVVVDPAHQSCGVGRAVLQAALDWAANHGASRAQLLADLDNAPALAFYQHLGWQATRLGARRLALTPLKA